MPILLMPVLERVDRVETLLDWLAWKLTPEHAGSRQAVLGPSCVAGVTTPLPPLKNHCGTKECLIGLDVE